MTNSAIIVRSEIWLTDLQYEKPGASVTAKKGKRGAAKETHCIKGKSWVSHACR